MSYFLTENRLTVNQTVVLGGDEAKHLLLSRRIRAGERVKLQDAAGQRFLVEILELKKGGVIAKVLSALAIPEELAQEIVLFQAMVSEQALDFILQKGTELGVAKIILFKAQHTALPFDKERFARKQPRWTKILWESAKQCERAKVPALSFVEFGEELLRLMGEMERLYILDQTGGKWPSESLKSSQPIGLVVGPEGGLTQEELERLRKIAGAQPICLSPFVLRAETAAVAGLAVCQNLARSL